MQNSLNDDVHLNNAITDELVELLFSIPVYFKFGKLFTAKSIILTGSHKKRCF